MTKINMRIATILQVANVYIYFMLGNNNNCTVYLYSAQYRHILQDS